MTRLKLPPLHSDFSVDCVIFGFDIDKSELNILLIERNEAPFKNWKAIPGNLAYDNEDIDTAANRVLYELTGLKDVYLDQLYSFGRIDRHPQGRVITVAYYALIKAKSNGLHPVTSFAKKVYWWTAHQLPKLAFDHNEIAEKGIERLKNKIKSQPIGFELLPEQFTLTQLQRLYEAILEKKIDKRNFRKKIQGYDLLIELKEKQKGVAHRAARLYKFNKKKYESLKKEGFAFKV